MLRVRRGWCWCAREPELQRQPHQWQVDQELLGFTSYALNQYFMLRCDVIGTLVACNKSTLRQVQDMVFNDLNPPRDRKVYNFHICRHFASESCENVSNIHTQVRFALAHRITTTVHSVHTTRYSFATTTMALTKLPLPTTLSVLLLLTFAALPTLCKLPTQQATQLKCWQSIPSKKS